ncbi:hypothetical protein [Vreelandella sp. EE27]
MNIVANKGDLFSIYLDKDFFCLGVVAEKWKSEFYILIFKEKFDSTTDVIEIELDQLTPVIASSSLDAKIWHGHWPIIRRDCDTSKILQPIYKVEEPGGAVAESFDRKSRKQVTRDVLDKLRYRKGVAPVRLEKAIKAYHGVGEWDATFEELRFSYVEESNLLVKSGRFQ